MHIAHARHKGRKGAHNRHESRQNNRFAAVFFVESMGFIQILAFEHARIRFGKQLFAEILADGEVYRIAYYRRRQEQRGRDMHIHPAQRRHRAGGKQERIARQKGRNHQPGFAKHDEEQNGINPQAVGLGELDEVLVDMQNEINQAGKHGETANRKNGRHCKARAGGLKGLRANRAANAVFAAG